MIPRVELLAILALTLLRTVQASPGPPTPFDPRANQEDLSTPFDTRANQEDLSPSKPLRFRRDIQDTTAPIVAIATPPALDNSARKVGIPEAIQVQWQNENGRDNEYPVLIRRNPLMPPKEPPVGQGSEKLCNPKKLGCRPTKFRMRARDVFEERGADRAVLAATAPDPPHVPVPTSMSPSVGKVEGSVLKTPLSRLLLGEEDPYPKPDWFPLKPEKRPPPPPVRRGGVNTAVEVPKANDPSLNPKQGPWIFGLGPAVSVTPPPASAEEGTVDKLLSRSGPVSRVMRPQYREKAAGERNNKASQPLDLKVTSSSDPLSEQLLGAEDNIGGGISSAALRRREPIATSKLNQRSETGANGLPKRATAMFVAPQPRRGPKQEKPLRDSSEQRNSLCGGVEQPSGKLEACVRWEDRKPKRSL
ncbi:hypothetical protein GX51_04065 [Blastomyces parvus]|uniref:Uncharacterized protein n=1 Tax=Blastomyces parvus TaxID=2060905 RepID=A0A2B7X3Q6_9EURO|nr:hypothetical protein GX51_04065 [Blastomyces parvus]